MNPPPRLSGKRPLSLPVLDQICALLEVWRILRFEDVSMRMAVYNSQFQYICSARARIALTIKKNHSGTTTPKFFFYNFHKMHRFSTKTLICHIAPVLKQNQKLILAFFLPKDSRNKRIQQYSSHPQNTPFCGEDASTPPVATLHYTRCCLNRGPEKTTYQIPAVLGVA